VVGCVPDAGTKEEMNARATPRSAVRQMHIKACNCDSIISRHDHRLCGRKSQKRRAGIPVKIARMMSRADGGAAPSDVESRAA